MQDFPTPDSVQNYSRHRRYYPPYHFFIVPVLLFNVVLALRNLVRQPDLNTAWGLLFAVALAGGVMAARRMALRVQDRVIRLEERLRLHRILGDERHAEIDRLGLRRMLALRFASDDEVPHLFDLIVREELRTPDEIKRAVQHWRADFLRA